MGVFGPQNQTARGDRRSKHHQAGPDPATDMLAQKRHVPFKIVAPRMRAHRLFRQDSQFRRGASHGRAWFEAADDRQSVSPAARLRRERERKREVDVTAGGEYRCKIERRWQDPDHRDWLTVERQRPSDDSPIRGKSPFPQAMTQQHRFRSTPLTFFVVEPSAELRLDPQQWEEVLRNRYAAEPLRFPTAGEFAVADAIEREVGSEICEGLILFAQVN